MSDVGVWDTGSELLSGEYRPVDRSSVYTAQDFAHEGGWFHTAALALDYEQVPGKLAVAYDGTEPVEVLVGGWAAPQPCCQGGHTREELEAAPVVAEDPSVPPMEWECGVCDRIVEPEVWYSEKIERLTPESPDGDDLDAGVVAEYAAGDPDGFAARASRVFDATMAQSIARLEARTERMGEDLQAAMEYGHGWKLIVQVGNEAQVGWDRGEVPDHAVTGDVVAVNVSAPSEDQCLLMVHGVKVTPTMAGHDAVAYGGTFVECTPAQAAKALLDPLALEKVVSYAPILARNSPTDSVAKSLRGMWIKRSGCYADEPALAVLASSEVADTLLGERRAHNEAILAARRGVEPGFEADTGMEL